MAPGARRRRAHAEHAVCRCCSRDRATRSGRRSARPRSSERALRPAEAVLHRLVSPRPDGGDRRRRLRPAAVEAEHQGALRADSRPRVSPRPRPAYHRAGARRDRSTRWSPTAKRTNTTVSVYRQDAGARSAHGRHVPAADGGAAVQRHAVRAARRDLAHARRAVPGAPQTARPVRADRWKRRRCRRWWPTAASSAG